VGGVKAKIFSKDETTNIYGIHSSKTFGSVMMKAIMYVFLIIIVFISILPMLWVTLSSFKTNHEILTSALSLPTSFNVTGYFDALNMVPMLTFYRNSIITATTSTALNVLLIGMAAYAVVRFAFWGKKIVVLLVGMILMLPMTAMITPVYLVIQRMGLLNTLTGLIFVYSALGFPTTFFVMRACFINLPQNIEEAAYIDGAGVFYTFLRIVLPMARPGLAAVAVIQFLMAWNEFLYALVLTTSLNVRTLPLSLNYFRAQFSFNYPAMFAAIVMIVIPSIVVFVVLQKQVVGSLTAGAVKG